MNSKLKEIALAINTVDATEAERLQTIFVLEMVKEWTGGEERAAATLQIFDDLRRIHRRDEVIAALTAAIASHGGKDRPEAIKAVADVMMSRSKWSPKRLREIYQAPRVYAAIAALHGLTSGAVGVDLKAVLKSMVEIGVKRRAGSFKGLVGEVQENANAEWWRAQ
jgi:hypothetical protein